MKKYREIWNSLEQDKMLFLLIILLLSFLLFVSVMVNLKIINQRNVVVEIPPYTKQGVILGSPTYANWWGRYFIETISNIGTTNVEEKQKMIKVFVDGSNYKKLSEQLDKEKSFIVEHEYNQFFTPKESSWEIMQISPTEYIISVEGELQSIVGKKVVETSDQLYWVKIKFIDTRVSLVDFGHGSKFEMKKKQEELKKKNKKN